MLTQQEADALIEALKKLNKVDAIFDFPQTGEYKKLDVVSSDGKHEFIIDINRKGCINLLQKCTYQDRYRRDIPLLRLDIEGPEHKNPDGEIIVGPHLHIYKENYADRYAYPIPAQFSDPTNLVQTLIDFLEYFKVTNSDELQIGTVI